MIRKLFINGEVPEWFNGAVSKTVVVLVATESSNLSLSASMSEDAMVAILSNNRIFFAP